MHKNTKKILIGLAGVLMSTSLVACGSKSVAITNGGRITQSEYYSSMKNTSNGKAVLQEMIIKKVLQKEYGSQVKESDVNAQFNQYKQQYGSQLDAMLQQQGMTTSTLKDNIKTQLLIKQAVKANTTFTTAKLKNQFKSFQPKVTVNEMLFKSKSQANNVINKLNSKNGKNFESLAKQYSQDTSNKDKGGRLTPFDNTDSSLDANFKKAAFNLKNGEYTKAPVKTQFGYQVIQMVNHPNKGSYNNHISELKDQIVNSEMNNQSFRQQVISKVLKNGGVQIQDNDLKNVLAGYMQSSSSSK
ncbi:foldase protein PrsA [Philodulcilactobacillus myokoensis]|uniref:Foldase protein PrsA n=1 Tax=Philodulcilactobacillus myokoensis TaxID=2929573 RepID=A0A9W6ET13_9LACO|nr:peptidylprolyl isomerase [Philodulcilactobacillus myokoensis]GLB46734.1 foldase protein PrsA [Philodulcilactobacillus myokoensis]